MLQRSSSSLACSTTKAPSVPCGRPTLPTCTRRSGSVICQLEGSVDDLEHQAAVAAGAGRPDDRPERARDTTLSPDHLADVVGRDAEAEDDDVPLVDALDPDGVGVVDEPPRDPGEQLLHAPPYSMPAALISRATGSEGCAPLASQSFTLSASRSIVDGSVCGLYRPTISMNRPSRGERESATTTR